MLDISRIKQCRLETTPYSWVKIDKLFSPGDAAALTATFPHDNYKTIEAYGGEKDYRYDARSLIPMGEKVIANPDKLSKEWLALVNDLLSDEYRAAMSALTGVDLSSTLMEVSAYHFGPGGMLGPHLDLPEKVVVHVLYFNDDWKANDGGCFAVLNSANSDDRVALVEPVIGNSATFIRSEKSWHEVTKVVDNSRQSRRSVNVTFWRAGSTSHMWPAGDNTPLHDYPKSTG